MLMPVDLRFSQYRIILRLCVTVKLGERPSGRLFSRISYVYKKRKLVLLTYTCFENTNFKQASYDREQFEHEMNFVLRYDFDSATTLGEHRKLHPEE